MRKSVHTRAYTVLRERLVAARHAAGLTQEQLAEKLGRPQSFVAKYEGGERRVDVVELIEIAQVLGSDLKHLLRTVEAAL
jgi:transcriptional regulator with XRE-family HTH domain